MFNECNNEMILSAIYDTSTSFRNKTKQKKFYIKQNKKNSVVFSLKYRKKYHLKQLIFHL